MSKFFADDIYYNVLPKIEYKFLNQSAIENEDIKLNIFKKIQIQILKFEGNYKLDEKGEQIILQSKKNKSKIIVCKSFVMYDDICGIEIQTKNINNIELQTIKSNFEKEFTNYKIIWTNLH